MLSSSSTLVPENSSVPEGWLLHVHPQGWIYFTNPSLKIVTDQASTQLLTLINRVLVAY
jgi:hypothetical protein